MGNKYLKILGLSEDTTPEEIKKRYREKAFETHPDRNNGDKEEFLKVQEAYEILTGKRNPPREERRQHRGPSDFSDFFHARYAQGPIRKQKPPPDETQVPVRMQMRVSDIREGRIANISYSISEDCSLCNKEGGEGKATCGRCSGAGFTMHEVTEYGMNMRVNRPCLHCKSRGYQFAKECTDCDGEGWKSVTKKLKFEVKVKEEE